MAFLFEVIFRSIVPPFYSFSLIEKLCKKKLERYPNHHEAIWLLSNLYVWYGRKYNEAKKLLESLVISGIDRRADRLLLARVYYKLKLHQKVVEILLKKDTLEDKDMENFFIGNSLVELDNHADAIRYLQKYLAYHRTRDYLVFTRLGYAYYMEGLYDHALNAYQNAKRLNPSEKGIIDNINLCIEKQKSKESVFH